MAICREVIAQLQKAQENRILIDTERNLLQLLKMRLLGLAAIEKSRAKQKSRITWLKKGDANTKKFHIMANIRRNKNFIHALESEEGLATSQAGKQEIIYHHFLKHTGTYLPRQCLLNFSELGWEPRDLDHLDMPFIEEEIREVIKSAPIDKAPRPDGFIGTFFAACWDILKEDIIQSI
jgi:hypothetical protein